MRKLHRKLHVITSVIRFSPHSMCGSIPHIGGYMNQKIYYRKPDGNFFLARGDDYTRHAYESMGFKPQAKDTKIHAIVMTPPINPDAMLSPVAAAIVSLMRSKSIWRGTASELQEFVGTGKVNQLFQPRIVDDLASRDITVVRKKSNGKRILELSRGST